MSIFKSMITHGKNYDNEDNSILKEWETGIEFPRYLDTLFSNCRDSLKEQFLNDFRDNVPAAFKNEIFTIKEASELLMFNPESLRRKIRQNNLPTENKDEVGGRVGYKILGDVIVDNNTQIFQKQNLLNYCIKRYPRESVLVMAKIITSYDVNTDKMSQDLLFFHNITSFCILLAILFNIPRDLLPTDKAVNTKELGLTEPVSFVVQYDWVKKRQHDDLVHEIDELKRHVIKVRSSSKKVTTDVNEKIKLEYNTIEEINKRKLELELEIIDLDIKIVELKMKEITDQSEMIKELQNRVELEKKKSELKEKLLKSEK